MVFRQLPLEDALKKTVAAGYDALELWPPQIAECRTSELRKRLSEYIRSLGVDVVRLNCADRDYFQSLSSPASIEPAFQGLCQDIDAAADLGMSQLLTWEGRRSPDYADNDVAGWVLDSTVELFERACEYGLAKNVSISVEIHPFTLGIDLDWLCSLVDRVGDQRVTVTYDCCHFAVGLPDDYVAAIDKLGSRIGHVHFSDSDKRSSELHFAPGTGCLDLDGIVSALKRIHFQGSMMLDLWLYPFPEEGGRIGVPYVREVIEKLGAK